jgi:hypothetical protein
MPAYHITGRPLPFTLYFSPNIISSDEVKDDMGYTEREENEKMLWKF